MGSGTVLVVEHNALVRAAVCRILASAGYKVVESSSAEHALQVIEDLSGIDLLLTAVGLPMMSGRRLAAAVLAAGYTMPVLFISGHPPEGTLPAHFIQKPFTRDELWAKVREVLAPVPAGGTPQG